MDTLSNEEEIALIDAGAGLAWRLVSDLRAQLARVAAGAFSLALLRGLVRNYLRPAEAALRRAIYLIADRLVPLPARAACARRSGPVPPAAGTGSPRTPAFRLTEPLARPPGNALPLARRPRISIAGLAPPPPPPSRAAPDPVRLEDSIHRRLAAFEAAFRNPERAARRLLRLLARRTSRRPMLAFTRIPGHGAATLDAGARTLLTDLNAALLAAIARPADTS